jgi:glycosyltransferase involved in cell wall biosynthesis
MSDFYVHTCLLEGFGNSMVEAMACGLPVIATDCPFGPREIIEDGYNGKLVSMDSVEALRDAIILLVENPAERKRLSANALKSVVRFDVSHMVERYKEIFVNTARGMHGHVQEGTNNFRQF